MPGPETDKGSSFSRGALPLQAQGKPNGTQPSASPGRHQDLRDIVTVKGPVVDTALLPFGSGEEVRAAGLLGSSLRDEHQSPVLSRPDYPPGLLS